MSTIPTKMHCDRCGKPAAEIARCPERISGNCPFVIVRNSNLAIFRSVVLIQPAARRKLFRFTFLGIELFHDWTFIDPPIPLPLPEIRLPTYPGSVAAFAPAMPGTDGRVNPPVQLSEDLFIARDIVMGAFLSLLYQGQIQICAVHRYRHARWNRAPHLVEVTYCCSLAAPVPPKRVGSVEREIFRVLANWSLSSKAREWQYGPSLFELVCGLYPGKVSEPSRWQLLVAAEDAESLGLCRIEEKLTPKATVWWFPGFLGELRLAHEEITALSQAVHKINPYLFFALDREIRRAIFAMQQTVDGY